MRGRHRYRERGGRMAARIDTRTIVVFVVALLVAGAAWLYLHDKRVREDAVARQRLEGLEVERLKQDSIIAIQARQLHVAVSRTDTVVVTVREVVTRYAEARAEVDTTHARQPTGTPVGSVVVTRDFIDHADSLAAIVPTLLARVAAEREAQAKLRQSSDSVRVILEGKVTLLESMGRPKRSDRLRDYLIGGAVALTVYIVLAD